METLREVVITADTLEELGRLLREDPSGGAHAWFDVQTGEVILTTSTYGLDEGDFSGDEADAEDDWAGEMEPVAATVVKLPTPERALPPWQAEERERVRAALADPERFLRVPVSIDHGAPGLLGQFARSLPDGRMADEVYAATHRPRAFRGVKDVLHRHGQMDLWHTFEQNKDVETAVEWLAEVGIAVKPAPG